MTDAIQAVAPADPQTVALAKLRAGLVEAIEPWLAAERAAWLEIRGYSDAVTVTDVASLTDATEWLAAWKEKLGGLEAVREAGPGAIGKIVRESNAKFKALRDLGDAAVANLTAEIGGHVQRERERQREGYAAAAEAHAAGQHFAAATALASASAADPTLPPGTTVKEVWAVDRYDLSIMVLSTDDYPGLVPDADAIAAYLRKLPIDAEPSLPGVICKKVPHTTQRKPRAKGDVES
jgi:hypothetical protein